MTMHCDFHNEQQRRMLKLADKIESLKAYEFDVSRWLTPSGAPSCIASWAVAMFYGQPTNDMNIGHVAMDVLGLDLEQGRKLFTPIWSDIYPETSGSDADYNNDFARHDITREWAAATLRHLAVTGEVDWHFTRRFGQKYANINKASPKGVMMPTRRVPEYISS
jgi:hypothetical protein